MKKRFLAMMLVVVMLVSAVLTSCANDTADAGDESEETSNALQETEPAPAEDSVSEEEAAPEQKAYSANVPEMDMDGRTFTFLTTNWQVNGYQRHEIWAEEYTGEGINDAIYERNLLMADRFDCAVFVQPCYDWQESQQKFQQTVQADDGAYQFLVQNLNRYQNSVTMGLYADLDTIPYLDFTQPYWDQNAYDQLSILNRHFVINSDITIKDKDFAAMVLFNKAVAEELQLGNLYDLVDNGTWTIDKVMELAQNAYKDLNGNSEKDSKDRIGMFGIRDSLMSFLNGGGLYLATKNEEDIPVHTLGTEEVLTALDKIADLMYNESIFMNAHIGNYPMETMFMQGQALFLQAKGEFLEIMRDMEDEFGILPIPKLSEEQEEYYCEVNAWAGLCFGVAINAVGEDDTADKQLGAFLETYACEGKNIIYPAYYDTLLQGKIARDDDSQAMLDLIYASRVYDVGAIGNWNDFALNLISMTMTSNRSFSSIAKSTTKVVTNRIEKMISEIQEKYPEA